MIFPMDLSGKHVLVTGASRGIGRAVSIMASKLGAKVSLVARDGASLKETLNLMEGEGHACFDCDLTEDGCAEHVIQISVEQNGKLDCLVHCAGITIDTPLKMITPQKARKVMEISYVAFASLVKAAGSKRYGNDGASLIGIASVAALHGSKSQGIYAAAKAAIVGFTAPAAKELAARKIRVNNVVLGMVHTDMYEGFLRNGGDNRALLENQYLGVLEPEDAAYSICFLLSDASKMITGTSFTVDGGFLS